MIRGVPAENETLDANLLVCWHRAAPVWREMRPLTPARREIMEASTAADCTLSSRGPNSFHSLMRGFFVRRKRSERTLPGGMTSNAPAVTRLSHGIYQVRCFLSPSVERRILEPVCSLNNVQTYALQKSSVPPTSPFDYMQKKNQTKKQVRLLSWKERTAVSGLGN